MKLDRMIGILALLLQRDKVTAPELAARFEVSRRTIGRDIEALCRAGIPLVTTQGAGGGISIMEGYRVDRTVLSGPEAQAILAGLRSLDSVSGTRRYARLMEKLSLYEPELLSADGHILIDLSSWYGPGLADTLEPIRRALEEGRRLHFRYYAPGGESERTVEPYYLLFHWSAWYLWAWCEARQDFRLFKLQRMEGLCLGERFTPRPAARPDLSNERVFPPRYTLRARVQPAYKWRLVDDYGPASFTQEPDGSLLFTFAFPDKESILRYIISFGGGAELLEPAELRKDLAQMAEALRAIHTP